MTEKTQPTDAELEAAWTDATGSSILPYPGEMLAFARAVLAKWGTPTGAGEPFCWHWENTFNGGMGAWKKNPETLGINMSHPDYKWTALYTTPQPTQAQAGAVPLTVDEIEQLIAQWSYELHGDRARYLVRMTEKHHGIKEGGQHADQ